MRRFIGVGGSTACLAWDDRRLDGFMRHLFRPWEIDEPDRTDVVFRATGTEHGIQVELPERTTVCSDERTAALELEYALTLYAQAQLDGFVQVHGACFGTDAGCVLIVGTHGIGKTTLALSAMSRGMRALSDDICPFDTDMTHLRGFPRPFKVAEDILALEPCPVPEDCPSFYATPDITYVFTHEPSGKYFADRLPLRHILFPERRPGPVDIEPMGQTEAMQLLLTQGFNYVDHDSLELARTLLEVLRRATPHRLRYGDSFEAVDAVRTLLA